jgi:uracil-DNA glycosylase
VIDALQIKVVLCFGGTAGRWVRNELNAHQHLDAYVESNRRGWRSEGHRASDGRAVVTLTHPGRANWCNPNSDPTPLVERVLTAVGA